MEHSQVREITSEQSPLIQAILCEHSKVKPHSVIRWMYFLAPITVSLSCIYNEVLAHFPLSYDKQGPYSEAPREGPYSFGILAYSTVLQVKNLVSTPKAQR